MYSRPCATTGLFLTSKVRLHCDHQQVQHRLIIGMLFLTSKVRLHCDEPIEWREEKLDDAFPDLKGQAPLRRLARLDVVDELPVLFLTSKVRLHCDNNNPWGVG